MPLRITEEQRAGWIAAILKDCPPITKDFAAYLDGKPSTVIVHGPEEFFEICRRDRAGLLNIARMEDGQFARDDGLPKFGYQFSVYYKQPEQTNLI